MYLHKTLIRKNTCTLVFIAALVTIAKTQKQPQHPLTDEWIKTWCIYGMGHYSAVKKNKRMPFAATWTQLEIITQVKHFRQGKKISCGITYMWNLK